MTTQQIWTYPALIAVLGQNRRPSFSEMRRLVIRVRLEVGSTDSPVAMRRQMVRDLVIAALKVPISHAVSGK